MAVSVDIVELSNEAEMPPHRERLRGEVQSPESIAFAREQLRARRDPEPRERLRGEVQGLESVAYTGVADGRVLFYDGARWAYFAHASLNWTADLCGPKASPMEYLKDEHLCGRALGIRFDKRTGDLYIADAYYGLFKVGLATPLATETEGVRFNFINDLDADRNVYFTDSSIL